MKRIKIGQIGVCHEHAAGKIQALRLLEDQFEIVGVVDDRPSTAAKGAGSDLTPYEGLPFMSEEELFRIPGLEAVTVEVPNLDLVPTASRCLEQNLPIHMDKPGGDDLAPFVKLRSEYETRGLAFQMGYMFRANPAMQWILEAVRKGWLGDIFEVQGSMSHNYGGEAYQTYIGSFPGGIMFNLGCHMIDFVVSLLGLPTAVTPFLKNAPGDEAHINNNCLTVMEYPQATVTMRACSREVGGLDRRWLKVCGTRGSVDLCPLERFDGKPLQLQLILSEAAGGFAASRHTLDFGPVRDRYETQMTELAHMVRGEISAPYGCEHDVNVQRVLLAAAGYTAWNG